MHVCQLSDVLNEDERSLLGDVLEGALEEAQAVLRQQETEPPPLFDIQTTGEAAEDYSNLVSTAKRRVTTLEKVMDLLQVASLQKGGEG